MKDLSFSPLKLEDSEKYNRYFALCPEKASDFTFVNLYGWTDERSFELAYTDNLCWIRLTGYDDLSYWCPMGDWFKVDWIDTLTEHFPDGVTLERVPESLAVHLSDLDSTRFEISEQKDEWEYIYRVSELVELSGNRFHSKKNKLSQFERKYNYRYADVTPSIIENILLMQEEWCEWRNCDGTPGLRAEHDAVVRVLGAWDHFPGIFGGVIYIDDKIAAYTIAEKLTDDTLLIHFEKGMTDYRGIYQAINQKFLEKKGASCEWVNRAQDMGKKGLRNAKMSYNPDHFLQKYLVKWKG